MRVGRRSRLALVGAALALAVLIALQFAVPPYAQHRIASRLTAHGGKASVHVSAFPFFTLVAGHGRSLRIDAHGLQLEPPRKRENVFHRLDGFGHVTIAIADSRAGPFAVRSFRLTKAAKHRYPIAVSGSTRPGDVGRYAGGAFGGAFGGALAGLAAATLAGDRPLPFAFHLTVDTSGGQPVAAAAQGTVAGFPAGPIGLVVADVVLARI